MELYGNPMKLIDVKSSIATELLYNLLLLLLCVYNNGLCKRKKTRMLLSPYTMFKASLSLPPAGFSLVRVHICEEDEYNNDIFITCVLWCVYNHQDVSYRHYDYRKIGKIVIYAFNVLEIELKVNILHTLCAQHIVVNSDTILGEMNFKGWWW